MFKVEVHGLAEFRRDLRSVGASELTRRITRGHKTIARRVGAASITRARGTSRAYAAAASGIKPKATQKSASITLDASKYPWLLGSEFGAKQYPQFPVWLGNSEWAGYAVYPTIRNLLPEIQESYTEDVMAALAVAYPGRG